MIGPGNGPSTRLCSAPGDTTNQGFVRGQVNDFATAWKFKKVPNAIQVGNKTADLSHSSEFAKSNGTKSCRANLHVLSKKVVEMSCLGIPQNVCNVSNGQITSSQKNFRFLQNALRNNLCGGFVQGHFYCSVQMVDMDVQVVRELRS